MLILEDEDVRSRAKEEAKGKRWMINASFLFLLDIYETNAFLEPIHSIHSSLAKARNVRHNKRQMKKNARVRPINAVASQRAYTVV